MSNRLTLQTYRKTWAFPSGIYTKERRCFNLSPSVQLRKVHRRDLPWIHYSDVLLIPPWYGEFLSVRLVPFSFQLVSNWKAWFCLCQELCCEDAPFHSHSGLKKLISNTRGILPFCVCHVGFLLSFFWLKQFNSCSDFTRQWISPLSCTEMNFHFKF